MWLCGVSHAYFVVWTTAGRPLYEKIKLGNEFITKVVNNLTLFYKSYVLPCMLGYQNIFQCPKCEKVMLEDKEISNPSKENSICCDSRTLGGIFHVLV